MQLITKHQFAAPDDGAGVEKITYELRRILSKTVSVKRSWALRAALLLGLAMLSFSGSLFLFPLILN